MTLMTAPLLTRSVSADELYAMEDAVNYELVGGELRERHVSRTSSRVAASISRLLGNEAERTGEAEVYGADLGYNCFPPDATKETRKPDADPRRPDGRGLVPQRPDP